MSPQDQRDDDNVLSQFPGDPNPQMSDNAGECTITAAFPPAIGSSSGDPTAWTSGFCDDAALSPFCQPDLSTFGVNWISPQYEENVDWNAIVAGISTNAQWSGNLETWEPGGATTVQEGRYIQEQYLPQQQRPQQVEQMSVHSETTQSDHVTTSTLGANSAENLYYVDGDGARAPFGGRIRGRGSVVTSEELHDIPGGATTASTSSHVSTSVHLFSQAAYDNLVHHISLERQHNDLAASCTSFPSSTLMRLFVSYYFEHFHSIFPYVRKSTLLQIASSEWLLLLAVAAVGSRYMHREQDRNARDMLTTTLDAALRRRKYGFVLEHAAQLHDDIFVPGECATPNTCPNIAVLQAGVLNVLLLQHSGKKTLIERAFIERHYLVEACHSLGLVSSKPVVEHTAGAPDRTSQDVVRQWLKRETEIRTGLMIWVGSNTIAYHTLANRRSI
jgi:hypothetical protein